MHQEMTFDEREQLKEFASEGKDLQQALIMITHWHRQERDIPFTQYASSWAAARPVGEIESMKKKWPLTGERHIAINGSDWE